MILIDGKERSCGAVLYHMENGKPVYLLTEGNSGHIAMPKGHMEAGETEQEAARREIFEETGIRVGEFDPGFYEEYHREQLTKHGNKKDVVFFLTEFPNDGTERRQVEEIKAIHILPFEEAYQKVNTEREREILKKAHEYITSK